MWRGQTLGAIALALALVLVLVTGLAVSGAEASDFVEAPGRSTVVANCTGCHSGRLVRQNRATREGWTEIIRWMQAKHGLWSFTPPVEAEILDYLATAYGPDRRDTGRRPPLDPALLPPGEEALRGEGAPRRHDVERGPDA